MDVLSIILCTIRTVFVVVNIVYTCGACILWLLLLYPLRHLYPALYWRLEGTLYNWLFCQVGHWIQSAGYSVVESGKDLKPFYNDEAIVFVNHQSTADVPLVMHCFGHKKGVGSRMMWIMDRILMYTNIGVIALIHGDFFIQQGTKGGRNDQMVYLENHVNDIYQKQSLKWITFFPEGGFLRKRREGSQKYARANNHPVLTHVSLPRLGALQTLLNNLHPEHSLVGKKTVKWVIDMTVAYPSGIPADLVRFMTAWDNPVPIHVHYRVFPISEVPIDPEQLQQWLYDVFVGKEELLDLFYKNGHFPIVEGATDVPGAVTGERRVEHDTTFLWSLHMFFIMSAFLQYYSIRYVYQLLF